jgi:hypothetical protein
MKHMREVATTMGTWNKESMNDVYDDLQSKGVMTMNMWDKYIMRNDKKWMLPTWILGITEKKRRKAKKVIR